MINHTLHHNLHNGCSQYCPVYPGGQTQVLLLEMHEPPFTQRQAGLNQKKKQCWITCFSTMNSTVASGHSNRQFASNSLEHDATMITSKYCSYIADVRTLQLLHYVIQYVCCMGTIAGPVKWVKPVLHTYVHYICQVQHMCNICTMHTAVLHPASLSVFFLPSISSQYCPVYPG